MKEAATFKFDRTYDDLTLPGEYTWPVVDLRDYLDKLGHTDIEVSIRVSRVEKKGYTRLDLVKQSLSYALYADDRLRTMEFCESGLKQVFGKVPKAIYFRVLKTKKK